MSKTVFLGFKYLLYTLLAINVYLFLRESQLNEALDTAAWVFLIISFELETLLLHRRGDLSLRQRQSFLLSRIAAYSVIVFACYEYWVASDFLDFANSLTWIVVVAVLESELMFKNLLKRHGLVVGSVKGVLYTLLLAFAVF